MKTCAVCLVVFIKIPVDLNFIQGDSGAPIWMYHMGRAFQIGVFSSDHAMTAKDNCGKPALAIYVPYYMDWILSVIKNN